MSRQHTLRPKNEPTGPNPGVEAAPAASGQERIETLSQLEGRLKDCLVPITPRPAFVAELKSQLLSARPADIALQAPEKEQRLRLIAGLGGALYLAGLGFVSFRAAQAVTRRVAARAAGRIDPCALAEASAATLAAQ